MVEEETELLELIEQSATFRDSGKKVSLDAERDLQFLKEKAGTTSTDTRKSNEVARLPKQELPKFGGDKLEWQNFWDQFTTVVDKSSMAEVSKFTYLQSLFVGRHQNCGQCFVFNNGKLWSCM
ncbi:hypothetical protein HOLleu_15551 [Holothuria leucospilota]|uniref:Uncharacterized protein n=1 Tax=Holothuria leucospilota TaxID=206669 RepID=A0A9Q1HA10_HOLLE|nr:hypothetical protein HOLleu_15551 [Holothuria leucospilota]